MYGKRERERKNPMNICYLADVHRDRKNRLRVHFRPLWPDLETISLGSAFCFCQKRYPMPIFTVWVRILASSEPLITFFKPVNSSA